MVTANATSRGVLTRNLAIGGALAALAAGALTMTDRALAEAPPDVPFCAKTTGGGLATPTGAQVNIPDGTGEREIPLTVTGGPTSLTDVDVFTNITHTWSGDLDIEVISPAGTRVLLKGQSSEPDPNDPSGPGVVWDKNDVFAGTTWDDQASELASETTYADQVKTRLAPEGSLGAFIGENANGTWRLRVRDVEEGEVGQINSWSLSLTGVSAAPTPTQVNATGAPGAIPDAPAAGYSNTVTITGAKSYLTDVNLRTSITHEASGDLEIRLTHTPPGGTAKTVVISTGNGGADANVFTSRLWDDNGASPVTTANLLAPGSLVPEQALASFIGRNPNGTWTLSVKDVRALETGNVASWSIETKSTDGCGTAPAPNPDPAPNPAPGGGTTVTPQLPPGPVAKLKPRAVGLKLSGRDRRAPYVVKASGKVTAPAGRTCVGKVQVTVKAGKKVVATKRVSVNRKCTYTAKFTFKKLPKGLPKSGKVTVSARFLGNAGLAARTSKAGSVRLG